MIPTGEPSMGCAVCAWVPIGEVDRHVGDSRGGRGRLAAGYRRGVRLKRFLRRRILLALAVVVVLGGAGGFIYTRVASGATVTYRTAAAQLGTVIQSVSLSGNLTPTQESNLDFGSSGRVTAVDVQPGQSVTTGATLATIDPTLLNAQLAEAQANLASAQAKLALDQAGSSISTDETSVSNAKVSLDNTLASDKLKISQAEAAVTDAQDAYNADGCAANGSATGCSGPSGATATLQNDQDNLEFDPDLRHPGPGPGRGPGHLDRECADHRAAAAARSDRGGPGGGRGRPGHRPVRPDRGHWGHHHRAVGGRGGRGQHRGR